MIGIQQSVLRRKVSSYVLIVYQWSHQCMNSFRKCWTIRRTISPMKRSGMMERSLEMLSSSSDASSLKWSPRCSMHLTIYPKLVYKSHLSSRLRQMAHMMKPTWASCPFHNSHVKEREAALFYRSNRTGFKKKVQRPRFPKRWKVYWKTSSALAILLLVA